MSSFNSYNVFFDENVLASNTLLLMEATKSCKTMKRPGKSGVYLKIECPVRPLIEIHSDVLEPILKTRFLKIVNHLEKTIAEGQELY